MSRTFRVTVELDIEATGFANAESIVHTGMAIWFNEACRMNEERKSIDDPEMVHPSYFHTKKIKKMGENRGK